MNKLARQFPKGSVLVFCRDRPYSKSNGLGIVLEVFSDAGLAVVTEDGSVVECGLKHNDAEKISQIDLSKYIYTNILSSMRDYLRGSFNDAFDAYRPLTYNRSYYGMNLCQEEYYR